MNVAAVSSTLGVASQPSGPRDRTAPTRIEDVQKVAKQFEAIIVRQLLKPAIDPIMSGGSMGGGGSVGGGGGGVYGYLLTDVLANSLSSGGQMGFANMVEQQLTPAALKAAYGQSAGSDPAADATLAAELSSQIFPEL